MTCRRTLLTTLFFAALLAAGCSGGKDKGKNQDFDRPKSSAKETK